MDLRKLPLFEMMTRKMSWLAARQQVVAQNIANADTPGYKPLDVKPLDFKSMVNGTAAALAPTVTNPAHLVSMTIGQGGGVKGQKEKKPVETTVSGNAVTLDEELMKANQTSMDYELTTNLYHKHLAMIREALGGGGGG